ncbi:MAG: hypothetical protein KJ941_10870 [Bacteroidetes bacterium]|nr:hypothetical protein [Bacteroidota bacterium]
MNRPMSVETNRRQGRNLVLLEGILGSKGSVLRIHQSELAKHGFCFETVTGVRVFTNKIVYQCYHFSYTIGVDGIVRIKRHDQVRCHLPGFYERWVLEYPETLIQENKRVALKTMQLKMRDS